MGAANLCGHDLPKQDEARKSATQSEHSGEDDLGSHTTDEKDQNETPLDEDLRDTNKGAQQDHKMQNEESTMEMRRTQTALLRVCRLLRRLNQELLDLQRRARRVSRQDSTALPPVPPSYR